jgi:predicted ATPase
MALSAEHGLVLYQAMARLIRGWALIYRGSAEAAVDQIRQGLAAWEKTGAQLMRPHYLGLLAEALAATGRHAAALEAIDHALEHTGRTGESCYEAELHRLKGDRLLAADLTGASDQRAQACFAQSFTIAARQGAKALELRTAISVARMHAARGRHDLARAVLDPIFNQFADGPETLDLRDARALLDAHSPA